MNPSGVPQNIPPSKWNLLEEAFRAGKAHPPFTFEEIQAMVEEAHGQDLGFLPSLKDYLVEGCAEDGFPPHVKGDPNAGMMVWDDPTHPPKHLPCRCVKSARLMKVAEVLHPSLSAVRRRRQSSLRGLCSQNLVVSWATLEELWSEIFYALFFTPDPEGWCLSVGEDLVEAARAKDFHSKSSEGSEEAEEVRVEAESLYTWAVRGSLHIFLYSGEDSPKAKSLLGDALRLRASKGLKSWVFHKESLPKGVQKTTSDSKFNSISLA
jgi:hypothetical protein